MECPICGYKIDAFAVQCPHCKHYVKEENNYTLNKQTTNRINTRTVNKTILSISLYCIVFIVIISAISGIYHVTSLRHKESLYTAAIEAIKQEHWEIAIEKLNKAGDYKDAKVRLKYAIGENTKAIYKAKIAEEQRKKQEKILRDKQEYEARQKRLLELVDGDMTEYNRLLELKKNHPDWSDEVCAVIAQKYIIRSMTKEQLVESLGNPGHINLTIGEWGRHEQWVYYRGHLYVYIENGSVTSWQMDM